MHLMYPRHPPEEGRVGEIATGGFCDLRAEKRKKESGTSGGDEREIEQTTEKKGENFS